MVDHGLLPRSTSRFVDTVRGQRPCFYYRLLPVPLFFVRHEEVPYLGAGPLGQICESSCRYVAVFVLFSASRSWSGRSAIWVMLVKAAKKEAQAKAALLASVQAQQDETILEASTRATIDALVGEGFSASRTLRDHVKRWAEMIRAEYAGETRCDKAQLAKALAERFSATPDLNAEQ